MSPFVLTMLGALCFVFGLSAGAAISRRRERRHVQSVASRWIDLPSGFFHEYGPDFIGYVSPTSDGAYWWLSRRGRTIIEGPASTVGRGKEQVERAAADFRV